MTTDITTPTEAHMTQPHIRQTGTGRVLLTVLLLLAAGGVGGFLAGLTIFA